MKKMIIFSAIITALAGGVCRADMDQLIFTVAFSPVTAGVSQSTTIEARETGALKTDYNGFVYLSVQGGGEVIVDATGTSRTPDFSGGTWTGTVRILKAGGAIIVAAYDPAVPAVTGYSAPVVISTGAYKKLKILTDDMVFAPGTVTGHAGTASLKTTQADFNVTVYACDDWYNPKTPTAATGIRIIKDFLSGYISVTPYCDISNSYDLSGPGVCSITFTVSVWPNPNDPKLYGIYAKDDGQGYENHLEINFFSLTTYFYETHAPVLVTAGVPFGVTVTVSHFIPPAGLPDTTFTDAVRLKAINPLNAADAVPVLCNASLVPQPTPPSVSCIAGQAYFNVAYTKSGNLCMMPIPGGSKNISNTAKPSSYLPAFIVGAAAPYSVSVTAGAERLQRNKSTQITVNPYDSFGNPVTGTAVAFSIDSGTGALSASSVNTNGYGTAVVTYTAPEGNYENIISISVPPVAAIQYVTIISELTDKFENWPNPFIPGPPPDNGTKINYSLPVDSAVKLRLYSSFGKLAWSKDIAKGEIVGGQNHGKKGGNTVIWDGTGDRGFVLGAGVYILKMTITNSSGTSVKTRKIAIVK